MEYRDRIKEAFSEIDISLSDTQASQFEQYYRLLIKKNEVMNLTAITDFEEVLSKHFLDSLMICRMKSWKEYLGEESYSLIDVGTGAGFPGIPIKIVYPKVKVVLLDSLNKRVQFLNEVISLIKLQDINAVHGRAEDFAKNPEYREQFDFCVSRAVANLASLSEYCIPFIKKGGNFIPYKSEKIEEEINDANNAIYLLGGTITEKEDFSLPNSDIYRCLLNIRKERTTPKKYPRKAGMPTKEPLH